jgi:ferredoxin-type protein NapH
MTAIIGALIVGVAYALIGGRVYCSWVCPINPVTDGAHWLHEKLGLQKGWQPKKNTRYWVLGMVLIVSALTGTIAWEFVNPITMLHRGLVFGIGFAWSFVIAVFLFDLFVSRRGWCGHLCPVGAFYDLLGTKSILRVSARNRAACDDCMDCFAVCPEMHVITPALRGKGDETPLILSPDCTNCGRCIDVCSVDVFRFTHRFDQSPAPGRDDAATQSPARDARAA